MYLYLITKLEKLKIQKTIAFKLLNLGYLTTRITIDKQNESYNVGN